MRLITHNMLQCNVKGVSGGYPLIIEPESIDVVDSAYDKDMIKSMLKRINFQALKSAAKNISNQDIEAFDSITEELLEDESFLMKIHHLLFEVHIIEGVLVCPESGRRFPIKEGIPNMLLHEDEI